MRERDFTRLWYQMLQQKRDVHLIQNDTLKVNYQLFVRSWNTPFLVLRVLEEPRYLPKIDFRCSSLNTTIDQKAPIGTCDLVANPKSDDKKRKRGRPPLDNSNDNRKETNEKIGQNKPKPRKIIKLSDIPEKKVKQNFTNESHIASSSSRPTKPGTINEKAKNAHSPPEALNLKANHKKSTHQDYPNTELSNKLDLSVVKVGNKNDDSLSTLPSQKNNNNDIDKNFYVSNISTQGMPLPDGSENPLVEHDKVVHAEVVLPNLLMDKVQENKSPKEFTEVENTATNCMEFKVVDTMHFSNNSTEVDQTPLEFKDDLNHNISSGEQLSNMSTEVEKTPLELEADLNNELNYDDYDDVLSISPDTSLDGFDIEKTNTTIQNRDNILSLKSYRIPKHHSLKENADASAHQCVVLKHHNVTTVLPPKKSTNLTGSIEESVDSNDLRDTPKVHVFGESNYISSTSTSDTHLSKVVRGDAIEKMPQFLPKTETPQKTTGQHPQNVPIETIINGPQHVNKTYNQQQVNNDQHHFKKKNKHDLNLWVPSVQPVDSVSQNTNFTISALPQANLPKEHVYGEKNHAVEKETLQWPHETEIPQKRTVQHPPNLANVTNFSDPQYLSKPSNQQQLKQNQHHLNNNHQHDPNIWVPSVQTLDLGCQNVEFPSFPPTPIYSPAIPFNASNNQQQLYNNPQRQPTPDFPKPPLVIDKYHRLFGIKCFRFLDKDCSNIVSCKHNLASQSNVLSDLSRLNKLKLRAVYRRVLCCSVLFEDYFFNFAIIFGNRKMSYHLIQMTVDCLLYKKYCAPVFKHILSGLKQCGMVQEAAIGVLMNHLWLPVHAVKYPQMMNELLNFLASANWQDYMMELLDLFNNHHYPVPFDFIVPLARKVMKDGNVAAIKNALDLCLFLKLENNEHAICTALGILHSNYSR